MDKALLEKFKSGKCSKEELRKILKWYQSHDAEISFTEQIEHLWKQYEEDNPDMSLNENEIWQNIRKKTDDPGKDIYFYQSSNNNTSPHWKNRFAKSYYLAASVVILVGVAIGLATLYHWDFQWAKTDKIVAQNIVKSTSKGQKTTIFLSDGSKVKLNANSKLVFPKIFTDTNRVVSLEGEAYFEVESDKSKPFKVVTDHVTTTALGTAFNIRAYVNDNEVKVSLAHGTVVVNNNERKNSPNILTLKPGDQAIYNKSEGQIKSASYDYKKELAWKEDILYFKDAPWDEIVTTLENWYGVEIIVKNSLFKDKLYTGEFKDESLQNVLESIGFTKGFNFKIEGKRIEIKFENQKL